MDKQEAIYTDINETKETLREELKEFPQEQIDKCMTSFDLGVWACLNAIEKLGGDHGKTEVAAGGNDTDEVGG